MPQRSQHRDSSDSPGSDFLRILRSEKIFWTIFVVGALFFVSALILTQSENDARSLTGTITAGVIPVLITLWQFLDSRALQKSQASKRIGIRPESLVPFAQEIESIAKTPRHQWNSTSIEKQRKMIMDRLVTLLEEAGVSRPRSCLYKVNVDGEKTDIYGDQITSRAALQEIHAVDELAYITHTGTQKPKDIYRQITPKKGKPTYEWRRDDTRDTFQKDARVAALFEPLNTKNLSRQGSRPRYSPNKHHWRSTVRLPLLAGGKDVELLLTVDTPEKDGLRPEFDGLIRLAGSTIVLLLSITDGDVSGKGTARAMMARVRQQQVRTGLAE